jgi:hypothetical protein
MCPMVPVPVEAQANRLPPRTAASSCASVLKPVLLCARSTLTERENCVTGWKSRSTLYGWFGKTAGLMASVPMVPSNSA